jgi:hypothetical protein
MCGESSPRHLSKNYAARCLNYALALSHPPKGSPACCSIRGQGEQTPFLKSESTGRPSFLRFPRSRRSRTHALSTCIVRRRWRISGLLHRQREPRTEHHRDVRFDEEKAASSWRPLYFYCFLPFVRFATLATGASGTLAFSNSSNRNSTRSRSVLKPPFRYNLSTTASSCR